MMNSAPHDGAFFMVRPPGRAMLVARNQARWDLAV
jgi:hypothetical protein